jgi:hypothetical protein
MNSVFFIIQILFFERVESLVVDLELLSIEMFTIFGMKLILDNDDEEFFFSFFDGINDEFMVILKS